MRESEAPDTKNANWRNDKFGRYESESWFSLCWLLLLVLIWVAILEVSAWSQARRKLAAGAPHVVIAYCAQDQVYAEPIFRDFEKETGIRVRVVYDSEAVKTVALANRLIAEQNRPQ